MGILIKYFSSVIDVYNLGNMDIVYTEVWKHNSTIPIALCNEIQELCGRNEGQSFPSQ